jgi:hypothetical protein
MRDACRVWQTTTDPWPIHPLHAALVAAQSLAEIIIRAVRRSMMAVARHSSVARRAMQPAAMLAQLVMTIAR